MHRCRSFLSLADSQHCDDSFACFCLALSDCWETHWRIGSYVQRECGCGGASSGLGRCVRETGRGCVRHRSVPTRCDPPVGPVWRLWRSCAPPRSGTADQEGERCRTVFDWLQFWDHTMYVTVGGTWNSEGICVHISLSVIYYCHVLLCRALLFSLFSWVLSTHTLSLLLWLPRLVGSTPSGTQVLGHTIEQQSLPVVWTSQAGAACGEGVAHSFS